ncbi:MAG: PhzF family phenazine biosynthesis protein [Oscillospiraceae bacterium]|nr:PhzF family phenazine biosynthesis protein [Oscillospiraceae bacterium]
MKYYVVDVFTEELFKGNPAGVCIMDAFPDDIVLQNIAAENNLSETAFVLKREDYYVLRWFTPKMEVDLCGHATIASAFVLFKFFEKNAKDISFKTMSGAVRVERKGEMLFLDFPVRRARAVESYKAFDEAFSCTNKGVYLANDFMVILENELQVKNIKPDFEKLKRIKEEAGMLNDNFGVIITAPGNLCDFVSRFFAPNAGVDEDPVTGRAHCTLIPYWAEKLGKSKMWARQVSARAGDIDCMLHGERVIIGGKAVLYLSGEIMI